MAFEDSESIEINKYTLLSDVPSKKVLIECANASYGLGNRFTVDWERFYEFLEMEGWDMQDLGGRVDNKIRRIVQQAARDGEIQ